MIRKEKKGKGALVDEPVTVRYVNGGKLGE